MSVKMDRKTQQVFKGLWFVSGRHQLPTLVVRYIDAIGVGGQRGCHRSVHVCDKTRPNALYNNMVQSAVLFKINKQTQVRFCEFLLKEHAFPTNLKLRKPLETKYTHKKCSHQLVVSLAFTKSLKTRTSPKLIKWRESSVFWNGYKNKWTEYLLSIWNDAKLGNFKLLSYLVIKPHVSRSASRAYILNVACASLVMWNNCQ